ncbi:unnamed protein product [Gongylonema pulchrum]|uniref:BMERB domain-containing protein n=1 Tax=Gongylonema pulchrum TaxID=637853 RepID=A0A183DZD3_9BILA|nr:unnamed protein product [Gongylonema pulchrum]
MQDSRRDEEVRHEEELADLRIQLRRKEEEILKLEAQVEARNHKIMLLQTELPRVAIKDEEEEERARFMRVDAARDRNEEEPCAREPTPPECRQQ